MTYKSKAISAGTSSSDNSRTLVLSHLSRIDFNVQQGTSQKVLMTNNMSEGTLGWNLKKGPKINF